MVFPVTLILYIVLWVILFGFYSCNLMQIKRFYKSCNLKNGKRLVVLILFYGKEVIVCRSLKCQLPYVLLSYN